MDAYELFYINKLNPKYNKANTNLGPPSIIPKYEPSFTTLTLQKFLDRYKTGSKEQQIKNKKRKKKVKETKERRLREIKKLPVIDKLTRDTIINMYEQNEFIVQYKDEIISLSIFTGNRGKDNLFNRHKYELFNIASQKVKALYKEYFDFIIKCAKSVEINTDYTSQIKIKEPNITTPKYKSIKLLVGNQKLKITPNAHMAIFRKNIYSNYSKNYAFITSTLLSSTYKILDLSFTWRYME